MTREEVIAILESYKKVEDDRTETLLHYGCDNTKEATKRKEALDLAIKILSVPEREKGEWVYSERFSTIYPMYVCSKCSGLNRSCYDNFCSNCGADMRGGKE